MTMRPAPNWKTFEDPVDGVWKEDLLRWLGETFGIDTLVETGTCEGSTIFALRNDFKHIYSIELSDYYHQIAISRLKGLTNINLFLGDSRAILPKILSMIPRKPTLFWLDAHSSGGLTANEGDPLGVEIQIITKLRPDALVVIDDMKDAELSHLGIPLYGWHREYRTGEVIIHRGGYIIPPFENNE